MAGIVFAGERKLVKSSEMFAPTVALTVRGRDHPWVSRGGIKLAHALDHFHIEPRGFIALDIGSSTGGFTDVLLSHGAARVYAVDVGTNQLAWKLRQDPRVIVHERTNARALSSEHVPEPVDIIVCDASFISLTKVLEKPLAFARAGTWLVALVKPQFEAGRADVGKGGVVRDPRIHAQVCANAEQWVQGRGWEIVGITPSPITGPEGNIEFLLAAKKKTSVSPSVPPSLPHEKSDG